MTETSFDVRIWQIRRIPGVKRKPFQQRWRVGDRKQPFSASFATEPLAEGFQEDLKAAVRRGEAFSLADGLPPSMRQHSPGEPTDQGPTWYEHALDYMAYKWPRVAATNRFSITWVIAETTVALLPDAPERPADRELRAALRHWGLLPDKTRLSHQVPSEVKETLSWIEEHSPAVNTLSDLSRVRALLDRLTMTERGKRASANYFNRRRAVLYNALKYAVTLGRMETNPLDASGLGWEKPNGLDTDDIVDPRVVGNTEQIEAMLTAVSYVGRSRGPKLVAFYACMYYAMMRPSEVINLKKSQCELPDEGWGRIILEGAAPEIGGNYTDDGASHDDRGLKGRNPRATRPVPIPPRLVELLRDHIDRYGTAADGRLFRTSTGKHIGGDAYRSVWRTARGYGIDWDERETPRLKRPYDLRHSGVSLRRTAGVPSKQVAEWAGHSVEVLERVYSKVLEGFDDRWQQQMDDFF